MHGVRPYLLGERGLDRDQVSISGYWRRGRSEEGFRQWKAELRAAEGADREAVRRREPLSSRKNNEHPEQGAQQPQPTPIHTARRDAGTVSGQPGEQVADTGAEHCHAEELAGRMRFSLPSPSKTVAASGRLRIPATRSRTRAASRWSRARCGLRSRGSWGEDEIWSSGRARVPITALFVLGCRQNTSSFLGGTHAITSSHPRRPRRLGRGPLDRPVTPGRLQRPPPSAPPAPAVPRPTTA